MTDTEMFDLYRDYLISSFGQTTATGLSALLDGRISHDRIRRFLAGTARTSAEVWHLVKPHVRAIQHHDGVLILDDSISEKPYTDENDIICWHYDHAHECTVKGINFITALYHAQGVSLPVGVTIIAKTEHYIDKKDGKEQRRSPIEKNVFFRAMIQQAVDTKIPFQYVLTDVWYAAAENMRCIKQTGEKDVVTPLKRHRKIALRATDTPQGHDVHLRTLDLNPHTVREMYLEGVTFPLLLVKQIFVNEDGSNGVLYVVPSNTSITSDDSVARYRKRWNIEPYHQSLKQHASLERSPTPTVTTQTNHFFAARSGYIKLERLKIMTKLNHVALKATLYALAVRSSFAMVREFQACPIGI